MPGMVHDRLDDLAIEKVNGHLLDGATLCLERELAAALSRHHLS